MHISPNGAMSERPALLVFDLGGTLVKDGGEVPAAFSEALHEGGVPFEPAQLTSWRGASKREVLRGLLSHDGPELSAADPRLDVIYRRFRAGLLERLGRAGELGLPGVRQALERLRAADVRLGLASGFDREILEIVLGTVDWADLLDVSVSSEDVTQGRPAPFMIFRAMEQTGVSDVHRVGIVGDTLLDLQAGWNAGAACRIGVLTGAHDRATLSSGPATHLVPAASDVPDLWLAEPQ